MKNQFLKSITPDTIHAIAQDLYETECWRGLNSLESELLKDCKEMYMALTGEPVTLIYIPAS